jgi:hypothetical protein
MSSAIPPFPQLTRSFFASSGRTGDVGRRVSTLPGESHQTAPRTDLRGRFAHVTRSHCHVSIPAVSATGSPCRSSLATSDYTMSLTHS